MARSVEVLLDTNFLVLNVPGIDVEKEVKGIVPGAKLVTIESVVRELDNIPGGGIGKAFISAKGVRILPSRGFADDEIVKMASKSGMVVCTNDAQLIMRLREKNVPVIRLRGKTKLEMRGIAD
ncbi:MAG: hypothetical protein JW834_00515 [Candidatus Diapherotrites archaeon]|nr:hypothetical protein [Candidatus Diapherotrites archaeon]